MVQGQDYMVDMAKHPNQIPIIFAEWPKMRVALHCHDGIQYLFDLSIRATFLQPHRLISLVVQCRQQNCSFGWVVRVQNRQFLCNPTKLITKPSFDEYQLLMLFELVHVACSTIFSAWYCRKQSIFRRQLSVVLKMDYFHYVSLIAVNALR